MKSVEVDRPRISRRYIPMPTRPVTVVRHDASWQAAIALAALAALLVVVAMIAPGARFIRSPARISVLGTVSLNPDAPSHPGDPREPADLGTPLPELPSGFYVAAADGGSTGDGSLDRPLDLQTALSSVSPVGPGGTLLLRGGTYVGNYKSSLKGTVDQRITVRSFPGEWAVLDGASVRAATLYVEGPNVTFKDFEVMKSDAVRRSSYGTNNPSDISRAYWSGVWVYAPKTKLIDLVVHDNGDGIGFWNPATDSEVRGCVIYNNGWVGSDRAWGHGIYMQNISATKTIAGNVVFNNFGFGIQAYTPSQKLVGFRIENNTSFENGSPAGTRNPNLLVGSITGLTDDVTVKDNVLYHRPGPIGYNVRLGYPYKEGSAEGGGSVSVLGNAIIGGSRNLAVRGWLNAEAKSNVLVGRPASNRSTSIITEIEPRPATEGTSSAHTWSGNVYRDTNQPAGSARSFATGPERSLERMTFSSWQGRSLDKDSRYVASGPAGQRVSVTPDAYERGRGFVTVLTWSSATTVTIDLSALGLRAGESYEIRDVQNLRASPVVRGTYQGTPVSVPLTASSTIAPIGGSAVTVTHTPRELMTFAVFRL